MRGLFMRDYNSKLKAIFPTPPVLHIPGINISDDSFQWLIDRIDSGDNEEIINWLKSVYWVHINKTKEKLWAWYVTNPGYYGIWLSNEKVANNVFNYYKKKGEDVFLLYLPVPSDGKNFVNDHENIEDLIL